jgi:hypothetical protein
MGFQLRALSTFFSLFVHPNSTVTFIHPYMRRDFHCAVQNMHSYIYQECAFLRRVDFLKQRGWKQGIHKPDLGLTAQADLPKIIDDAGESWVVIKQAVRAGDACILPSQFPTDPLEALSYLNKGLEAFGRLTLEVRQYVVKFARSEVDEYATLKTTNKADEAIVSRYKHVIERMEAWLD